MWPTKWEEYNRIGGDMKSFVLKVFLVMGPYMKIKNLPSDIEAKHAKYLSLSLTNPINFMCNMLFSVLLTPTSPMIYKSILFLSNLIYLQKPMKSYGDRWNPPMPSLCSHLISTLSWVGALLLFLLLIKSFNYDNFLTS